MLEPPRAWGLTLPLPCSLARCSPPSLPLCFSALSLSLSLCPINMPLFRGARKNTEMQHLGNLLICDQFLFRNETNIISSNWRILLITPENYFQQRWQHYTSDILPDTVGFFQIWSYRRRTWTGSSGQDIVQADTFWGVLNVSLRASGTQLFFHGKGKPTKNHEKPGNHLEKPWEPNKNHEKP